MTRNHVGSARAGSNPAVHDYFSKIFAFFSFQYFCFLCVLRYQFILRSRTGNSSELPSGEHQLTPAYRRTPQDLITRNPEVSFLYDQLAKMSKLYDGWNEVLKIQKFRRGVGKTIFFSFSALISYAYNSNTTRAGYSRGDQFYASYPAGSELLTDTTKLYKSALGNCFEEEEWGPVEWSIMAKHFERQGKSPYAYHAQYQAHIASNGHLDGSG
ncbi:hypothetical protein SSX86_020750 [Deinandra increscens subsp. villosa]|uniref:Uncharacterized protein n=1 Tax=Deinandra increscens subsp. villosa TaxID=3103831 RepID=A0AAP0GSH8_9ASTR